jgi:hypothetical protein
VDTSKASENKESDNFRVHPLSSLEELIKLNCFDSFKVKLTSQILNELKEEVISNGTNGV